MYESWDNSNLREEHHIRVFYIRFYLDLDINTKDFVKHSVWTFANLYVI